MKKLFIVTCFNLLLICNTNAQCEGRFYDSGNQYGFAQTQCFDLADINNDGNIDVFIGNGEPNANFILLNDGNGEFNQMGNIGLNYTIDLQLIDIDNDGDIDAFEVHENGISIWENDGTANFSNSQNIYLDNNENLKVKLADLDNDGDVDALVSNRTSNLVSGSSTVLFNDGNGFFTQSTQSILPMFDSYDVDLNDFDGDGDIDAYLTNYSYYDTITGTTLYDSLSKILLNDGNGIFTESNLIIPTPYRSVRSEVGDINGDGATDLITLSFDSICIFTNSGNLDFTNSQNISFGEVNDIDLKDLNNDGDLDIIAIGTDSLNLSKTFILDNNGTGHFTIISNIEVYSLNNIDQVQCADFNNDGNLDAFISHEQQMGNQILYNGVNSALTTTSSNCNNNCNGSATLNFINGVNPITYNWNDPNNQTSSTASELCPGNYTVTATDSLGCNITESVEVDQIIIPALPLCVISVDTTSSRNVVVWEKPITSAIDYFNVYRELSTGIYSIVASVDYDSLSQFTDNTLGVNPNITSYRYKLTYTDNCGNESELSDYHETMHLSTNLSPNGGVNLIWDGYEGIDFAYYRILRDTTFNNNWEVLDSVTNNVFIWSDIHPAANGAQYQIEVVLPYTCTSTRAVDHNTTRSNRGTVAGQGLAPEADFSVNYNTINIGDTISFYDLSLNNPTNRFWYFEGGSPGFSTEINPSTIVYHSAGSFDVTLVVQNQMGLDTLTLSNFIEVYPGSGLPPNCNFSANNTQIVQGEKVDFYDESTNFPINWKWLFDGGNPAFSTDQNPINIEYNNPGIYNVTLIVTNPIGADTLVNQSYIEVSSNVGFTEKDKLKVRVYPNPTNNWTTVFFNKINNPINLSLKDFSGREIYSEKVTSTTHQIDLSTFAKGIYLIDFKSGEFQTRHKIFKK